MFYDQKRENVIQTLESDKDKWLSKKIAEKRLKTYGQNKIQEKNTFSIIKILWDQFKDPLVIVLIGAVILSIILQEYSDAIAIGAIIVLNALFGFFQEYKAEKSIAMLSKLTSPTAKVVRDGEEIIIPAALLVPGDIVLLEAGDKISADIRLIEAINLTIDESILTGESNTVNKNTDIIPEKTILAERHNMAFAWTITSTGKAKGIVVKTGMQTELGAIAEMVQSTKETQTPLQKKLKKLWVLLWGIALAICIIVLIIGVIKWFSLIDMIFIAISLAVSAIPEWLPAVVTITLALGVQKMYRKNALIRKLKAVETLWSTTVICTDKTGTITQNRMTAVAIMVDGKYFSLEQTTNKETKKYTQIWNIAAHCNDAHLPNIGDPTEIALLEKANEMGIDKNKPRTDEIPFSSENKYMVTVHDTISYLKWSPEIVLSMCDRYEENGEIHPMTKSKKEEIQKHLDHMTSQALRVLGMAYNNSKEEKYIFVGLIWLMDPPREEAKEALRLCKQAGIDVIMITGDNKDTAMAVAKLVGIQGKAMTGAEFDELWDIQELPEGVKIFARVNPSHKVKILQLLQKKWEIVAMTGDGVNDAPALKWADVGVAMSKKWTDVARETSDMILIDDNFASIVSAIEFGRIIYDNIKKAVKYLLSVNFDEILVIGICIILGVPLPMIPIQILRMNLVTDSLPTLALSVEPWEEWIMKRKPRSKHEHILSWSRAFIITSTIIAAAVTLLLFRRELHITWIEKARTVIVTASIVFELLMLFAVRSDIHNVWNLKINKYLLGAISISILLQIAAIYTPLNSFLKFTPLNRQDRLLIIGAGLIWLIVFELIKLFRRKTSA